jgi:PPP family 3-phenylpropionic acid transporter
MLKFFYVCFFISWGVAVPFFAPYLRGLGLSGREVSRMMSVAPTLHLFIPLLWGWLADRTRRPDRLLRIACAGAAITLVPLWGLRPTPGETSHLLLLYAAHQVFLVPTLGLADSLAVERMRRLGEDYTSVRLWGSASFLLVCVLAGWWLDARGQTADVLVLQLMSLGLALATLTAFGLRGETGRPQPHLREVGALLKQKRFVFLLVLAPLHWAGLTPYHGFLGILARDRGFSSFLIGAAFLVAVLAEVIAFIVFPRLRRRASLEALLAVTTGLTAVRWFLTSGMLFGEPSPAMLLGLQALHAASFGIFWGSTMAWLSDAVPPGIRATGQALFTSATFGVGNLVGYAVCGRLYDRTGGAEAGFFAAACLELVPFTMAIWVWRRRRRDPTTATATPGSTTTTPESTNSAADSTAAPLSQIPSQPLAGDGR